MGNYKESLAKLKKQLAASRFLRWWLGELAGMVPPGLRRNGPGLGDFALVGLDGDDAVLRVIAGGKFREVSRLALKAPATSGQRAAFLAGLDREGTGRREAAITLPPGRILRKSLTLPLAAEENLRQVLEFQMEQHTPFSAGRVYFGYRVTGRDFERGQLSLDFAVTPREAVDEAVRTLAGWDVQVRAVIAEDMLAQGNPVNMLPSVQGKASFSLLYGANPWLAALVLVLALAALTMPLVIKREAVTQLLPWVEKGKTAAEAVDAMRQKLETRVEEHNYLLEKKRALPPVISVLEELSRVLPDDTWVQQMDIKGKELQIQGETASSSRLVSLFEQSGMFRDASFRSPLTKGQGTGAERYHLALEIHPLPPGQEQAADPAVKPPAPPAPTAQPQAPSDAGAARPSAPATEKKP